MPRTSGAGACDHSRLGASVYFLLSSTPDRASRLPRVLATMRRQTLKPTAIVLSLAEAYNATRFVNATYAVPSTLLDPGAQPRLLVHTIPHDLGPITKYAGAELLLRQGSASKAIVVVGDDDMYYGETFIEDYACAVASAPAGIVFSSGIDRDCLGKATLSACVMGFRGVGLRAGMLQDLGAAMRVPRECFLADDLAISYYLAVLHSFDIRRLRLRSKYKFDDEFAWSNSSINTYHRHLKFGVNRACAASLRRLERTRRSEGTAYPAVGARRARMQAG